MNAYSSTVAPARSRTTLIVGMVAGTLVGLGSVGVTALVVFISYAYASMKSALDSGSMLFLGVMVIIMGGVLVCLPTMWVLFFTHRYRGAFIASMVPIAFAVAIFILWVVVLPLLALATSPYNH